MLVIALGLSLMALPRPAVAEPAKQPPSCVVVHPCYIHHRDGNLKFTGSFNGKPAAFKPVIGHGWYRAAWQTWRLPVSPSPEPQPFDVQIHSNLPADLEYRISAHFVPK